MSRRSWVVLVAAVGCGPLVGIDGSGTDSETDTDSDTDTSGSESGSDSSTSIDPVTTTTPPPPPCPTVPLGPPPATIEGTSVGQPNVFTPSCSVGNGSESLALFVAPADGDYVFDTVGSSIDTILYALDGDCGGPELACNDDTSDMTSSLGLFLAEGQAVVLVVDTFGVAGDWVLNVGGGSTSTCPDEVVSADDTPWTRGGTTIGGANAGGSICGGQEAPERSHVWQVPVTGTYVFDTFGSTYDTVLYVTGGECMYDPVLECSDDVEFSVESGVVVDLAAGETITAVIDGLSSIGGEYVLTVDRLVDECARWSVGGGETSFAIPTMTSENPNTGGGSCGGWFARDRAWRWTPPEGGIYRISLDAEFLPVLTIMTGGCEQEIACASAPGENVVAVDVPLQADESIVIRVDGQEHEHGWVTLRVEPTTCPELELGTVAMVDISGTNVGASDTLDPSCASGGADWVYGWTAPATGTYTITTIGSDFDTVLAVREGSCLGEEIACDDDGAGDVQSLIELDAVAGQTYAILLDGFGGDIGDYVLTISP